MDLSLGVAAAIAAAVLALAYALSRARWIYRQPVGNEALGRISGHIALGARTFLSREYGVLAPFALGAALLLALANSGPLRLQALAFLLGALASASAGWYGMRVATAANARAAWAATKGVGPALGVAFAGGSVMGMTVVGLALLGIGATLALGSAFLGADAAALTSSVFPILTGFSLGASTIALFARVGGGIFTKAADVGADLVGKVEAGIPEDDPRNPAVIADNVGDNVGDVAGMGADLFESYAGSIVGCVILGAAAAAPDGTRLRLAVLPLVVCAIGVLASVAGCLLVRAKPDGKPQRALNTGTIGAALLAVALLYPAIRLFLGDGRFGPEAQGGLPAYGALRVFLAAAAGLAAGVAIGAITEFFTGSDSAPVRKIAKACGTGSATTIISGLGVGMVSTAPPVLVVGAAIWASHALAGLYGIGVAGLGMLVTLGIQLSVDAYGPIADNAGGLAVMAEMPPETRDVTDSLDAVGNTTAAVGKGFAIGSAALTSIVLFAAFVEAVGISAADVAVSSPAVIIGLFVGSMIPFLFSSLAMDAIGVSAFAMIEEVRRQFRERPGILSDDETPDYAACVDISTKSALRRMVLPGVIAVAAPVSVGLAGGPGMLAGLLAGSTATGVVLAIFMANSGGAWDNAKKLIEGRDVEGKGSASHKAAVVGDTVGDPFKDTAGPAINILIKLMAIIALVMAPLLAGRWR
ncbi:MAG TPA: sodium-translocating pyrophosphatase [Spirochaetia bacterium]|nr:sodium-translocating pyrophosphatase [Spirochaetia bacterium]